MGRMPAAEKFLGLLQLGHPFFQALVLSSTSRSFHRNAAPRTLRRNRCKSNPLPQEENDAHARPPRPLPPPNGVVFLTW